MLQIPTDDSFNVTMLDSQSSLLIIYNNNGDFITYFFCKIAIIMNFVVSQVRLNYVLLGLFSKETIIS